MPQVRRDFAAEWFDERRTKEGLQVGLQEGRQEGRIEGMRQMLLRLSRGTLRQTATACPPARSVALASSEELQRLLSRSFTAGSLENWDSSDLIEREWIFASSGGGSGIAQPALAILLDRLGRARRWQ